MSADQMNKWMKIAEKLNESLAETDGISSFRHTSSKPIYGPASAGTEDITLQDLDTPLDASLLGKLYRANKYDIYYVESIDMNSRHPIQLVELNDKHRFTTDRAGLRNMIERDLKKANGRGRRG